MEAKAKAGEEDLSMEEILQSIRKIIADDGEEAPSASGNAATSDVLELTDMIEEPAIMPAAAPIANGDILNTIDQALAPEPAVIKQQAPAIAANDQAYIDSLLSKESASAASAAFKKLAQPEAPMAQLSPSPVFNSGNTIENMVSEMLRPMLKQWLDGNLAPLVERIVEREVRKLTH